MSSLNALLYRLKCMSIYHTCKFWNKEQFSQTTSMWKLQTLYAFNHAWLYFMFSSLKLFFKNNLQESFYSLTVQDTTIYTFVTNSESGELSVANRCIWIFVAAGNYFRRDLNCSMTGDQIVIQTVRTQGDLNFYEVKAYRKLHFMKLTTNTIMYNINIKYDPQRRRK